MNIVILGAGAIGCYLGAALQAGGLKTTLLLRERMQQELTDAGQLTLSDYRGLQQRVPLPRLTTEPGVLAEADLIILTVKCLAVEAAALQIARYAQPATPVLALQNGIGSEQPLQERCSQQTLVRGIVGFNVAPLGQGRFHCGTQGEVYCEPGLTSLSLTRLQQALGRVGVELRVSEDFTALRWAKLQLNLNNAINALSNLPLKTELEQWGYRRVLSLAMSELLAVVRAQQLRLPKLTRLPPAWIPPLLKVPDALFRRLAGSMLAIDPQARSSMWEDLSHQRLTEVDFLNGAVVTAARSLGMEAPVNAALCRLIHQREGQSLQGMSAETLLQAVRTAAP